MSGSCEESVSGRSRVVLFYGPTRRVCRLSEHSGGVFQRVETSYDWTRVWRRGVYMHVPESGDVHTGDLLCCTLW
jgi:hypothetical protein